MISGSVSGSATVYIFRPSTAVLCYGICLRPGPRRCGVRLLVPLHPGWVPASSLYDCCSLLPCAACGTKCTSTLEQN